jgi:hypothetical protein
MAGVTIPSHIQVMYIPQTLHEPETLTLQCVARWAPNRARRRSFRLRRTALHASWRIGLGIGGLRGVGDSVHRYMRHIQSSGFRLEAALLGELEEEI